MKEKLSIQSYFEKKKKLQEYLLAFIDNIDDNHDDFYYLSNLINEQKIQNDAKELEHFLYLINRIVLNHHRESNFFEKIEKIFTFLKKDIKQTFSNSKLFEIFFNNKSILHFLIKQGFLTIEKSFISYLIDSGEENIPRYCHFFLPEMREFIEKEKISQIEQEILNFDPNSLDYYEERRLNGENEKYITSLIRNDSVDDFISYVNRFNYSLSNRINSSIFETNFFLIGKKPMLIEYAAFYGSIQIFNFLRFKVEVKSDIWLYAIHSNKPEMIHLLEEIDIAPNDETYEECLEESIKCHHIDIAHYIQDCLLTTDFDIKEKLISWSLRYDNYAFFPNNYDDIDKNNGLFYLNECDHSQIVTLLMKIKKKEIDSFISKFKSCTDIKTLISNIDQSNQQYDIYYLLKKMKKIAFLQDCKQFNMITIPHTIKTINKCSFYGCSMLKQVFIPSSVLKIEQHAFRECYSLEEITIPSSVKSIGEFAFDSCSSLKKISIPASVEFIGKCAFFRCLSLEQISIPSSIKKKLRVMYSLNVH